MCRKRMRGDEAEGEVEDPDEKKTKASKSKGIHSNLIYYCVNYINFIFLVLELKISDMDEWMDSDDDSSASDEEKEKEKEDSDSNSKKKKAKKGICNLT